MSFPRALIAAMQAELDKLFPNLPAVATIAEDVARITLIAIRNVQASGKPTDPAVWQRAYMAASAEFGSEAIANRWHPKARS